MADNITVAASTVATDEVSIGGTTAHVQRVKLGYGADGTYTADVSPTAPLPVTLYSETADNSISIHKTVAAGSTNATSVKASAGRIYGVLVNNVNAAVRYLKLYNKASAPTVGTDTPIMTIAVPTGTVQHMEFPWGLHCSAGIAFATTTEATDAGTTAISASESVIHVMYR